MCVQALKLQSVYFNADNGNRDYLSTSKDKIHLCQDPFFLKLLYKDLKYFSIFLHTFFLAQCLARLFVCGNQFAYQFIKSTKTCFCHLISRSSQTIVYRFPRQVGVPSGSSGKCCKATGFQLSHRFISTIKLNVHGKLPGLFLVQKRSGMQVKVHTKLILCYSKLKQVFDKGWV